MSSTIDEIEPTQKIDEIEQVKNIDSGQDTGQIFTPDPHLKDDKESDSGKRNYFHRLKDQHGNPIYPHDFNSNKLNNNHTEVDFIKNGSKNFNTNNDTQDKDTKDDSRPYKNLKFNNGWQEQYKDSNYSSVTKLIGTVFSVALISTGYVFGGVLGLAILGYSFRNSNKVPDRNNFRDNYNPARESVRRKIYNGQSKDCRDDNLNYLPKDLDEDSKQDVAKHFTSNSMNLESKKDEILLDQKSNNFQTQNQEQGLADQKSNNSQIEDQIQSPKSASVNYLDQDFKQDVAKHFTSNSMNLESKKDDILLDQKSNSSQTENQSKSPQIKNENNQEDLNPSKNEMELAIQKVRDWKQSPPENIPSSIVQKPLANQLDQKNNLVAEV